MAEVAAVSSTEPLMSVDPRMLVSEEVTFTDDPTFDQRVAEQQLAEAEAKSNYTSAPPPRPTIKATHSNTNN
jgi:hypothetical protein